MFRIQLDNGHETIGYTAGKMRRYRIRIFPGDRVKVELAVRPRSRSDRLPIPLAALLGHAATMAAWPLPTSCRRMLSSAFPDADELSVVDRTGGGDHFQVAVASGRFDGLPLVEQHKLVYAALEQPLADGTIHELRIKTKGAAS